MDVADDFLHALIVVFGVVGFVLAQNFNNVLARLATNDFPPIRFPNRRSCSRPLQASSRFRGPSCFTAASNS